MRDVFIIAASPDETRPCGVKDYSRLLCAHLRGVAASFVPVPTPQGQIRRNRLLDLLRARAVVRNSARSLSACDLVHSQYADFGWNGVRPFEDCYDVFTRNCEYPMAITIHEHPWLRDDHFWDEPRTLSDRIFGVVAAGKIFEHHGSRGCMGSREAGTESRDIRSLTLDVLLRHRGIHVHHRWHKRVLAECGVPEERVFVLPFPVLSQPACGLEREKDFRAKFGLGNKRIAAMAGFIFDRKRYELAVALLPLLPDDVAVCLLGGPNGRISESYCERLRQQARSLGVESRLVVTGYLPEEELDAGLAAASVVLAPYGEVSSTASVCRAIGAGVPVVASKCESFVEMEQDGAGLTTVDVENTDRFAEAVRRVLDHRSRAGELRSKNEAYAEAHSVEKFAGEMEKWYGGILTLLRPFNP